MDNGFLAAARTGRNESWRYFATVGLVIIMILATSVCMATVAIIGARTIDITKLPPLSLLAISLFPFVGAIVGVWLGVTRLHARPFLSLINPLAMRLDWRRFGLSAGLWLLLSASGDLILSILQPGNYVFRFDPARFLPFMLVAVLLIPLQSAAEELFFRGYLTQGLGRAGGFWVAWLVPSVLFGLLHGANPEVTSYGWLLTMPVYIGLGLLLGWVTLRSQSLELALGLHIANNLYSALAISYPSSALPTAGLFQIGTYYPAVTLVAAGIQMLVYLLLITTLGRRFFRKSLTTEMMLMTLALLLVLTACSPSPAAQPAATPEPAIPLTDCYLSIPGQVQVSAQCGTLAVPEDPDNPAGRMINLRIAVVRAVSRTPAPDPLFLLAGGPGQAASEAFTMTLPALERLRFKHDLVLVDQRGTGQSNALECPDTEETGPDEVAGRDLPIAEQVAEITQCLSAQKGDPRFYTTDIAMHDLDQVRQALGYDQVNLLGVSYGTRAALSYLRLYPEHTRTIILDGVVPPDWPLGATIAADAQRSLDLLFKRCQADPSCNEPFPDLSTEFQSLLDQAERQPAEVTVIHPTSGQPTRVLMTRRVIGSTVRLMTYSDLLSALLPLAVHSAAQGDYQLLASEFLQVTGDLNGGMSMGMYYSVICSEDVPFLPDQPADSGFLEYPFDEVRSACQVWLPAPLKDSAAAAFKSDKPALLISGEADPVTPPANGEAVAKLLSNSRHLILTGLGHNNFYAGCVPEILYQFVENANPQALDTTCTAKIKPQPFFTSPVGPKP